MAVDINDPMLCDGHRFKWLVAAGLAWLEQNHEKVDALNVFPVPDGDTGQNMLWTMRSAYKDIAGMDEANVSLVSDVVAHGALMGARGNSGVILSQIWQGFAQAVRGHEAIDSALFVAACNSAVDAAYRAVTNPVEGTILTVSREATEALAHYVDDHHEANLHILLKVLVEAAQTSVKHTPELLPVLKKAGVVDSGGQGLVYILQGMLRLVDGEAVMSPNGSSTIEVTKTWQEALEPEDEAGYGYDVQFLMHGQGMNVAEIRAAIDAMGWSTLVVGSDRLIKVHVHVHDPGQPISYAIGLGVSIDDVVVENMQDQYQHYVEERQARETGEGREVSADAVAVIAVASGEGLTGLFHSDLSAAHMIAGGQTMNPSTKDFLSAIDSLPNQRIILLPNNKNVVLAAQQAASLARDKDVRVVVSRTLPQGISAMFGYANAVESDNIDQIVAAMNESLDFVTSGEVTTATRDVEIDGLEVRTGQYIGLLNGDLVVAGDVLIDVMVDLLEQAADDDTELVTLIYGDTFDEAAAQAVLEALEARFDDLEFELVAGNQPLYPFIISVE